MYGWPFSLIPMLLQTDLNLIRRLAVDHLQGSYLEAATLIYSGQASSS